MLKASIISAAIVALMSFTVQQELPPPDPYEGCCGTEPVQFQLDGNLIYIPNIFTPNGDAINDLFKPMFDPTKIRLESMRITGGENNSSLIFTMSHEDSEKPYWGWFGYVSQDSIYAGKFQYTTTLKSIATGEQRTITGTACSAVCNSAAKIAITDRNRCFFPMQFAKDSIYRESPIYLEIECLNP